MADENKNQWMRQRVGVRRLDFVTCSNEKNVWLSEVAAIEAVFKSASFTRCSS